MRTWRDGTAGAFALPSGRLVRGRGLRLRPVAGELPEYGVYLQHRAPPTNDSPGRWVRWRDFWLPDDPADMIDAVHDVWRRAERHRVEVACTGGRGRTGTFLACLSILDGVPAPEAVAYVRHHYRPDSVETPWQRRYVHRFPRALGEDRERPGRP